MSFSGIDALEDVQDDLELVLQQVATGELSLSAALGVLEAEPEPDPAHWQVASKSQRGEAQVAKRRPEAEKRREPRQLEVAREPKRPEAKDIASAPLLVEAYEDLDPFCKGCRVQKMQLKALADQMSALGRAVVGLAGKQPSSQELSLLVLSQCSPCSHLDLGLGTLCASLQSAVNLKAQHSPEPRQAPPEPKVEAVKSSLLDPQPAPPRPSNSEMQSARLARPLPPSVQDDTVRFHNFSVEGGAVEVLRFPAAAPCPALLRMPQLSGSSGSGARAASRSKSPKLTPYELHVKPPQREEPESLTSQAGDAYPARQAPRPTQCAEVLEDVWPPSEQLPVVRRASRPEQRIAPRPDLLPGQPSPTQDSEPPSPLSPPSRRAVPPQQQAEQLSSGLSDSLRQQLPAQQTIAEEMRQTQLTPRTQAPGEMQTGESEQTQELKADTQQEQQDQQMPRKQTQPQETHTQQTKQQEKQPEETQQTTQTGEMRQPQQTPHTDQKEDMQQEQQQTPTQQADKQETQQKAAPQQPQQADTLQSQQALQSGEMRQPQQTPRADQNEDMQQEQQQTPTQQADKQETQQKAAPQQPQQADTLQSQQAPQFGEMRQPQQTPRTDQKEDMQQEQQQTPTQQADKQETQQKAAPQQPQQADTLQSQQA
ncbi:unnamed protein product, partial [Effrenium voratum]